MLQCWQSPEGVQSLLYHVTWMHTTLLQVDEFMLAARAPGRHRMTAMIGLHSCRPL